jgi:hypothetical protein
MSFLATIRQLTSLLFPTGRAFKVPFNGWLDNLVQALTLSENAAYVDAVAVLDSILPDNDNFSVDDATDWERRLGMITATGVALADRKLAIKRKINHPGDIPARQHYLYIQGQLQAAGFDVYVYENRFDDGMGGYETQTPFEILGGGLSEVQHGDIQHGDAQHGGVWSNIIANYIDEAIDSLFYIPTNQRGTFFIGGDPLGTYANVEAARKDEFRQLILKLKPAQMVGYLFVNYV